MAIAKVEEYARIGEFGVQAPVGPPTRVQTVTYTGTSAHTAALRSDTSLIVISVDTDAYWRLGHVEAGAADSTDSMIVAGVRLPLAVSGSPAKYVAFVTK